MDATDNPRRKEEIRRVLEQAAEWFTLFEEGAGSADEQAAFSRWMTESPLHVRAFLNVSAVDRMVEAADPGRELGIAAVGPQNAAADKVVPQNREWQNGAPAASPWWSARSRRPLFLGGLAAAFLALLAGGAWQLLPELVARPGYTTGTGEQRSIALNDGSLVHLNAKSRLKVRFSPQARELRLFEGEALFNVAHDVKKPFRVYVGHSVVQAIGTQFDIDRRPDRTVVSVLDGIVQVSADAPSATGASPIRLTAGQSVIVGPDGRIAQPGPANVEQVTAWRQRRLVFDEDTLADIATEFNRYNRVPQLRIEGESVRRRRYAAVFDADDPEPLLQFLKKDRDLAFEARGDELIIRPREYLGNR